jgi:phospholipid-binding lipoprotein MlaA
MGYQRLGHTVGRSRRVNRVNIRPIGLGAAALTFAVSLSSGAAFAAQPAHSGMGAAAAAGAAAAVHDPLEPMNRKLFAFGQVVDAYVVRPTALGYKHALPAVVRKRVTNIFQNLGEPLTFVNDVLQLHQQKASDAMTRFVLNSTIGLAGMFDFAGGQGVAYHTSDLGQTLGHYGVGPGPYLYLPVLGPSDFRDGAGMLAETYANPLNLHDLHLSWGTRVGIALVDGIDTRANLDDALEDLKRSSTDEYATLRSVYMQARLAKILDQNNAIQQLPDFDAPASAAPASPNH